MWRILNQIMDFSKQMGHWFLSVVFLRPKNIQLPIQVISIQFKISYIQIILTLIEHH